MPVPSSITDLDVIATNNSPQGTESAKGKVDDYFRAFGAILKTVHNDVQTRAKASEVGTAVSGVIPSGTKMLFVQSSAPTGWTKSTTHHDKALRVVSGTASFGGTRGFTATFTTRTPSGSIGGTALTVEQMPSHTHEATYVLGDNNNDYGAPPAASSGGSHGTHTIVMGAVGGGQAHTHSLSLSDMDFAVQYVDVIICTKD